MDHGYLDEDEANTAIGALVNRMVEQLGFTAPGAVATSAFEIDGVRYEVSVSKAK